jgi:hypothetical protein
LAAAEGSRKEVFTTQDKAFVKSWVKIGGGGKSWQKSEHRSVGRGRRERGEGVEKREERWGMKEKEGIRVRIDRNVGKSGYSLRLGNAGD